ncbi:MAG: hypothetical protein JWN67_5051 [Actinomycetia bacterium]|nr:hypothetical protein [Actinomycetes bacterium]
MEVLQLVIAACAVAGALVVAFGFGQSKMKDATIDTQQGLITALEAEGKQRDKDIATLSGKVDVLQSTWASQVATTVADEVVRRIALHLKEGTR